MNRSAITGSFYGACSQAKIGGVAFIVGGRRRRMHAPIDRVWNVTAFTSHRARAQTTSGLLA